MYYPGDVVTGNVYLRIVKPVEVHHLDLEIRGKEKAKWRYRHENHTRTAKGKHEILHFDFKIFDFAVPVLAPGDYVVPFSFTLPPGLPSSLVYHKHDCFESPKAKIKFHIRALLKNHVGHKVMTHK